MRCCAAQCSAAPREWRVEVIGDCHGAGRLAEQSHLGQGVGGGGGSGGEGSGGVYADRLNVQNITQPWFQVNIIYAKNSVNFI